MVIEPLLSLLSTGLTVGAVAGLLSLLVWAIALLFARYRLTTYGSRVTLLQLLVVVAGLLLVDRLLSRGMAASVGVVVAALWCGAVIHETYRRATAHPLAATDQAPTAQAARGAATLPTTQQPYSSYPRSAARLPTGAGAAGASATGSGQPLLKPFAALAEWVDLQQLPTRPLAKRPALGKRTVHAFQVKR